MKQQLIFYILCMTLLVMACDGKIEETTAEVYEPYTGPLTAFQNIVTEYSKKGNAKVILKAPVKLGLQNKDESYPNGVHLDFYGDYGNKQTVLIADSAKYISEQRIYVMMGEVKVTNIIEQQSLETPTLYWDERFKEIYTDTTVKITTTTEVLYGIGMRAKQDFSQYKILKPTGIISVKEAQ